MEENSAWNESCLNLFHDMLVYKSGLCYDMFHDMLFISFCYVSTICFTICLFISPDLDGNRAPERH